MSDSLLLLDAILREISVSKELTEENIHLLFILFQETLYEALYLIENNAVKRVKCKTGRELYHVTDITLEASNNNNTTSIQPYTCFIYPRYCSCPEFFDFTIYEQKTLMCRHVLAVILGDTLNMLQDNDLIDDEEFGELLYRWQVEE